MYITHNTTQKCKYFPGVSIRDSTWGLHDKEWTKHFFFSLKKHNTIIHNIKIHKADTDFFLETLFPI